jgi:hypothetical protein
MYSIIRAHCTEKIRFICPRNKTAQLRYKFLYIHVSVSYLNIPKIGLPIWLRQHRLTDPGVSVIF